MKQPKEKPLRMCVVCRSMREKEELIRIVCDKEGKITVNADKKSAGRGAYVCRSGCIETLCKKKLLNRSFKKEVEQDVYDRIRECEVKKD